MAGRFSKGETKIRPGVYFNATSETSLELSGAIDGVVAVAFKANFGPLNQVVNLTSYAQIADIFGDDSIAGSNTKLLEEIFIGGAATVKAVRVGNGGTKAMITLKDTTNETPVEVAVIAQKYAGTRALSITIKDSLAIATKRECIIYSGTKELMKVTFDKGTNEVDSLVEAINNYEGGIVDATKLAAGNGTLAALTQTAFTTAGASPTVTNADYSNAFELLEAETFNVLCIDSNDAQLHALAKAFIERAYDAGLLAQLVIGEPTSVTLTTRKANAAAKNSQQVVYVGNGFVYNNEDIEGYLAAGYAAGVIAATPANKAITHVTVNNATDLVGALTNTQIEECLQSGMLIFTKSTRGYVQFEQGINTLISLTDDQDAGWKKIRRTKTRYELIDRVNRNTESLIGQLNNDQNGQQTLIMICNAVIKDMVAENKLISGTVSLDSTTPAAGDYAYFIISVYDLDSLEKVYFTYTFHYSE